MVNLTTLNDDNFDLFAAKGYKNYQCQSRKEFLSDIALLTEINKNLTKRQNIRLIVNQIIIFFNVFEIESAVKMLFYRIAKNKHPALKTILLYLNYLSDNPDYDQIPVDQGIQEALGDL